MKKYLIASIICFVLIPLFLIGVVLMYDHLALLYQRPNHPLVNLTALAGFFGTACLIAGGVVNAVKAGKAKRNSLRN